jgi:hypothetical protein
MADILKDYPTDSGVQGNRAECGGVRKGEEKELRYDPPKGPSGQMRQGPGLHGNVHPCGTQGKH